MPASHIGRPLPAQRCVLRYALERWAGELPEKVFAVFCGGEEWTYRALRERVLTTARGLQQLEVRQGDHVLIWLPNGREALRFVCAVNYIGAVCVPINKGHFYACRLCPT